MGLWDKTKTSAKKVTKGVRDTKRAIRKRQKTAHRRRVKQLERDSKEVEARLKLQKKEAKLVRVSTTRKESFEEKVKRLF